MKISLKFETSTIKIQPRKKSTEMPPSEKVVPFSRPNGVDVSSKLEISILEFVSEHAQYLGLTEEVLDSLWTFINSGFKNGSELRRLNQKKQFVFIVHADLTTDIVLNPEVVNLKAEYQTKKRKEAFEKIIAESQQKIESAKDDADYLSLSKAGNFWAHKNLCPNHIREVFNRFKNPSPGALQTSEKYADSADGKVVPIGIPFTSSDSVRQVQQVVADISEKIKTITALSDKSSFSKSPKFQEIQDLKVAAERSGMSFEDYLENFNLLALQKMRSEIDSVWKKTLKPTPIRNF